jgi:hypothetical protein
VRSAIAQLLANLCARPLSPICETTTRSAGVSFCIRQLTLGTIAIIGAAESRAYAGSRPKAPVLIPIESQDPAVLADTSNVTN